MKLATVLAIIAVSASWAAIASCTKDGKRTQMVWLTSEGKQLERWEPVAGEIHRVRLPGGFIAGIQIDPTTPEKYREVLAKTKWPAFDELVKISIYDANSGSPTLLSTTWGGANSTQGFGPRGGANGISELGDQIELWLQYPVCVTTETLATLNK